MIRIDVFVADPAGLLSPALFDAGALIRLERYGDEAETWGEIDTLALDLVTTQPFVFTDADGTSASLYRWRISNVGAATFSEYADPAVGRAVTGTAPGRTYAGLADLIRGAKTPPLPSMYPRLAELLVVATEELIHEMGGVDFFRHPVIGTETWTAEGEGDGTLHVHGGLISLASLEMSLDRGVSFQTVETSGWVLEGRSPGDSGPGTVGEPYFHVRLVYPFAISGAFPRWPAATRLTGVRGWPAVPVLLREGVVERARQLAAADLSLSGSVPGPSEYAAGQTFEYWPQLVYRFLQSESQRFWCDL